VIATLGRWLRYWLVLVLVMVVRFYQLCLRPVLPSVCRFYPSCSEYFILAVHKHGPIRGACKGVGRLCRCHPWSAGGYDPP
jgi:putative membrane protein insertion efficiency factor